MKRLAVSRIAVRMARANTAGGGNWAKSVSASAGTASNRPLASTMASCTRATRSNGSGSSVGSVAKMAETRLVHFSVSSPLRIETGTIATSGSSGSSSWSSSHRRSPPAHMAMTTSLTVAPRAFLTSFTAASEVERKANRRWGVMAALNRSRGAFVGSGPLTSPSGTRVRPKLSTAPSGPRSPSLTWLAAMTIIGLRVALPSSRTVRAPSSTARPGLWTRFVAARTSISPSVGTRSVGAFLVGRGRQGVALRVAIEHEHQQLGARGAVDRGVVDLREDAEPAVGQALDDVGLPERPAPIEGTPDDPGDDLGELVVTPGRRHAGVADVEVEVEVGILDPVGVVEAERHLAETAPQRLEEMEPALDLRPPGGERVVVGVVLGLGVDREAGDVAELRARFHVQERGVEAGQLLHGPLPPLRTAAPALCHRTGGAARQTTSAARIRHGTEVPDGAGSTFESGSTRSTRESPR